MTERIGYVVITYNQTGGQPDLASYGLYDDMDDAKAERDSQEIATKAAGRRERHVVAEVIELDGEDGDA